MQQKIPKLVITGGPCGGKTSAITFLVKKLTELGYFPLIVPEAATSLINSGMSPFGGEVALRNFQEGVIDFITLHESKAVDGAIQSGHAKPVILCDRGYMDGRAYVSEEMFQSILNAKSLCVVSARDACYLGVFHMRTAAFGAESYYTTANNEARTETIEEARILDERTLSAWVGHHSLSVIGNSGRGFDAKLELLWGHVLRVLGEPEPHEIERRFLVEPVLASMLPAHSVQVEILQSYISSVELGAVRRIRRRAQHNAATYYETVKSPVRVGVVREIERQISADDYSRLESMRIANMETIRKIRHHFIYCDQYFELDVFRASLGGLFILEIELLHENAPVEIPPFLRVVREVTGMSEFSNYMLAKHGLPK